MKNSVTLKIATFGTVKTEVVKIGSDCFIGKCGGFRSVFGENGKVTKISDKYIWCTSESGSVVRYNVERTDVCGKWRDNYYFICFNQTREYCTPEHHTETIKSRPSVWNSEKCELEYK